MKSGGALGIHGTGDQITPILWCRYKDPPANIGVEDDYTVNQV
ncbi:MAG: hypothetical protein P8P65_01030 [Planktotalea sp.]|nr:hypothetical protein [Planktotalea sp.]EDZ43866.1 hypothetical protein RB2083_3381 [Rhodobacteraceae bacterium HTCC2083]MDG1075223.1 hypothetical protein [Planktotalea sp.]MDG1085518.1 hypothetical protein [Planktotalea sp.]